MLSHLNIYVYGRVQGVFLRRTVKHEASRQGISGFVRNEPDGSVYIEAEGDAEIIRVFVEWLKAGAGSDDAGGDGDYEITRVETEDGTFKAYSQFEIK